VTIGFVGQPILVSHANADDTVVAARIAARFREVGLRILGELQGAYAIAAFDAERRIGLVATDRMGVHPVFYRAAGGSIVFASSPRLVAEVAGIRQVIRSQSVFDYLFCHVVPAPVSIIEGVQRLLPGQCVELQAGQASVRQYWLPHFEERREATFAEKCAEFRQALDAAVRQAMAGGDCGAFLSGGTDSSTVVGLMTEIAGAPIRAYSIGFAVDGFDEMDYARLAAKHFGARHREYYVTAQDVVDTAPLIATAHPQPFGNSSALPAYCCARLASEDGVTRMLAGDGGDELFGGNARYAKQRVFAYYEAIPSWLRSGFIEPAVHALSAGPRLPGLGKVASYVEQAAVPMPERLETYNVLARLGVENVLTAELLEQVDQDEPARFNREMYFNPSAGSLINRMLALDYKTTLADNDLPKVMQSCALAGIDVNFPMLDARVVDFSLRLRPSDKLRGTRLRPFFKQALRDVLPPQIIRKKKHGFGLPFGQWVVSDARVRTLTFDLLNALKRREFVRPDFIDRLKDDLLPQHPNYYGSLAWVLMMLELWLAQHGNAGAKGEST
jgi:asparagine synthase (glutamine-hydrolysing)